MHYFQTPLFTVNQDYLKIFALLAMTLDHCAVILGLFNETGMIFQAIGRTAYPIFAFLICLNLSRYEIYSKYIKRLFIFGIITFLCLLPFDLLLNHSVSRLNILFSFLCPVITLDLIQKVNKDCHSPAFKRIKISLILFIIVFFLYLLCIRYLDTCLC